MVKVLLRMVLVIILLLGGSTHGVAERISVEDILVQALEEAVEIHVPTDRYSIFVDPKMRSLGQSGDWQGAGYDSVESALYDYALHMSLHLLGTPVGGDLNQLTTNIFNSTFYRKLREQHELGTIMVDQNHPQACDQGPGTDEQPLKTIARAAEIAVPGDTVIVREGVYRERVVPKRSGLQNAPITYMAAPDETVVIKGSDVWQPQWHQAQDVGQGIFVAELDENMFPDYTMFWASEYWYTNHPFQTAVVVSRFEEKLADAEISQWARPVAAPVRTTQTMPYTLGQIFADSVPVEQVASFQELQDRSRSFIVSPDGSQILFHPEPGHHPEDYFLEITTRAQVFVPASRELQHIHIRGFIIEHGANQGPYPQAGILSLRSGSHWVVEDNTIRYASTVGIDAGAETWGDSIPGPIPLPAGNIIRNNVVSDNGLVGIVSWRSRDLLIEGNVVTGNNHFRFHVGGYELYTQTHAGIKVLNGRNAIVRDNLVMDNYAYGIWLDNANPGSQVSGNLLINNLPQGLFLEMDHGPILVDNNVIIGSQGLTDPAWHGGAVYAHDAGGFTMRNNFLFNNEGHGLLGRTLGNRQIPTSNIQLVNNVMLGNGAYVLNIPFDGQFAGNNFSDFNVFGVEDKFVTSTWGTVPPQFPTQLRLIQEHVHGALSESAIPAWPGINRRFGPEGLILTLQQWQQAMGWDEHSSAGAILDVQFDREDFVLSFTVVDRDALIGDSQSWQGFDYFGNASSEVVYIGPFQRIEAGENRFELWPKSSNAPRDF